MANNSCQTISGHPTFMSGCTQALVFSHNSNTTATALAQLQLLSQPTKHKSKIQYQSRRILRFPREHFLDCQSHGHVWHQTRVLQRCVRHGRGFAPGQPHFNLFSFVGEAVCSQHGVPHDLVGDGANAAVLRQVRPTHARGLGLQCGTPSGSPPVGCSETAGLGLSSCSQSKGLSSMSVSLECPVESLQLAGRHVAGCPMSGGP